jgi:adenylosuccinate synthase
MKRAIITVGLGFGDEGKGATVDFLTRQYEADLVIRYCGGSQAGHNVQLPDGRRHTFSQFGAGTLAPHRPRTFLASNVIIDPFALLREGIHLCELGVDNPFALLTVHPNCLVTTPWLQLLNRLRELARGTMKHGSCGQGIGEARNYWLKFGSDAVIASDLRELHVLRAKLELQRQRSLLDIQDIVGQLSNVALRDFDLWNFNAEAVAEELRSAIAEEITIDSDVPAYRTAILEGAQGVLLDEYRGFHPYTTWSTVTPHHAWEFVQQSDAEAVSVLGITRTYTTRHGAGPLPSFSAALTERLRDPGNPPNAWQGSLRCGWLDLPLLRYAAKVAGPLDGLVVNHLDQVDSDWQVCEGYRNGELAPAEAPHLAWQERLTAQLAQAEPIFSSATREQLLDVLGQIAPVCIKGFGAAPAERSGTPLRFRLRRVKANERVVIN